MARTLTAIGDGRGELDGVDKIDVEAVLRGVAESFNGAPPGLDAFAGLAGPGFSWASHADLYGVIDEPLPWHDDGRRLMLIPCNRPADALAVLGYRGQHLPLAELTALLRSWEGRFAAVPNELIPEAVTLAVTAPPLDHEQARRVAAELLLAGRPFGGLSLFEEGAVDELAERVLPGSGAGRWDAHVRATPNHWCVGIDAL